MASKAGIEAIARESYERCHPGDSFADLLHRAGFSREDRFLRDQWLDYARKQAEQASA
ncbi:hypothetical protein ACFPLB_03400 [Aquamicrobium segne]|uniref:Uncharacterized protein n=1 Tax=Aquamicrobium segne TaxID=469547 RepID=A0ABW0GVW6_9HYPH